MAAPGGRTSFPPLAGTEADALTQRALRLISEQSSVVLNAIAEGVYVLDDEGRTLFVNEAAASLLGYSQREMVGQPQHQLIHYAYADGSPHAIEDCPIFHSVRDGVQQRVGGDVFWHKDGTPVAVEFTSIPFKQGRKVLGVVVTFRDIREHQRAEREKSARVEVERTLGELQRMLEQAPAAISMYRGPEHRIIFRNELARRLSPRPGVEGKRLREAFPELADQGLFELFDQVYRTGQSYTGRRTPVRWDRDGTGVLFEGYFDFSLQPLTEADGRVVGILSHSVDVSDRVDPNREITGSPAGAAPAQR